jgi:hypothetical protein
MFCSVNVLKQRNIWTKGRLFIDQGEKISTEVKCLSNGRVFNKWWSIYQMVRYLSHEMGYLPHALGYLWLEPNAVIFY